MKKLIIIIFLALLYSTSTVAQRGLGGLMQDGMATFLDAATLIYYSFRSNQSVDKKDNSTKNESLDSETTPEKMKDFLRKKGVEITMNSQPIKKESFAKTLIKRYKLNTSFYTKLLGWDNLYYSDAQSLGIFNKSESGIDILTTRDMLKAFFRAEKIRHR